MIEIKLPIVGKTYRVDLSEVPALFSTTSSHHILLCDVPVGTKFTTYGSTPSLRENLNIIHGCSLALCFEEKGAAYFCRENGEYVEIASCADLRLTVLDVPGMPH